MKQYTGFFILLGVALLLVFTWPDQADPTRTAQSALLAAQAPPSPPLVIDQFGIAESDYTVDRHRIAPRESLSEILERAGVPAEAAGAAIEQARQVFNVRGIRAGESVRIYKPRGAERPSLLVYEIDPIRYVRFDLRGDAVAVTQHSRPVREEQRAVFAVIDGSLYETLTAQGVDEAIVPKLAEIFAWQVNFYRIQRGDEVAVVFNERKVGRKVVGVGQVQAARMKHRGDDFYAFYFEQDGTGAFYDEAGNSLRKALLKAPLKFTRISSRYNPRRFHPVQKVYKAHLGTDFAAPTGTPVIAAGDGVVIEAGFSRGNGNYVKIQHDKTYTTGYLHFSRHAKGIRRGVRVRQGDVIGYVGSTGLATGPHLCYRFWKNGRQIDPFSENLPPSYPISDEARAAFEAQRDQLKPLLAAPPARANAL